MRALNCARLLVSFQIVTPIESFQTPLAGMCLFLVNRVDMSVKSGFSCERLGAFLAGKHVDFSASNRSSQREHLSLHVS